MKYMKRYEQMVDRKGTTNDFQIYEDMLVLKETWIKTTPRSFFHLFDRNPTAQLYNLNQSLIIHWLWFIDLLVFSYISRALPKLLFHCYFFI